MNSVAAMNAIAEVEVPVAVTLAEAELSIAEILAIRPGTTLPFPQSVDARLTLTVNGVDVGSGQAVERRGRLGFILDKPASAVTAKRWRGDR